MPLQKTQPNENRPTTSTKAANAPKGRFAGLRSAAPRHEFLGEGKHEALELIKTAVTFNKKTGHESCHLDFKVIKSDTLKPGDIRTVLQIINGKSNDVGPQKVMSCVVPLTGFSDDDSFYDQLGDKANEVLENVLTGKDDGTGPDTVYGLKVACVAVPGGTSADGKTQYYNYNWSPCEVDQEDEENA